MVDLALYTQVLCWLVVVGCFLATRQASLFHPATVYLGFHGLVFVLRPILVHFLGFDANWQYMAFEPTEDHFMRTLMVSSTGLICFVTASLVAGWTQTQFTDTRPSFGGEDRRALVVTTLVLLPLVAYSIYATRNGIEGERVGGIYIMTKSSGYLNEAQHFAMSLLCLWLIVTRFHWANLFPLAAYIAYRVWFGWSRWTILLFLLMVALVYLWYSRRRWAPLWSALALIPALILFNLLGHNRDLIKQFMAGETIHVVDASPGTTRSAKLQQQLDTQDYSNFDFLSYVVSVVPERTGRFTYGLQYLQLFTEPIPRILWKSKPVGPPIQTIDLGAYGNFLGLTVSLCGDGWMSGGWVGLIVTLGMAGALAGAGHRWFFDHQDRKLGPLVYIVCLALLPQWYRDGGISIFKFFLFALFPLIFWRFMLWLLGLRTVLAFSTPVARGTVLKIESARCGPPGLATIQRVQW